MRDIVLRADRPLCLYTGSDIWRITHYGKPVCGNDEDILSVSQGEMDQIFQRICDYSIYAHQENINSGFVTMRSGVRVGLCGTAVVREHRVINIKQITSLSFRVPRDVHSVADELLSLLAPCSSVLICGAPGSGKTTLLRDMARALSYRYRVSLLDERGEVGGWGAYSLGLCDIFCSYPKDTAMLSALRSMSPDIMICDELGDKFDARILQYMTRCGVSVIATAHASSMAELCSRSVMQALLKADAFRYVVIMKGKRMVGKIDRIYEMRERHA